MKVFANGTATFFHLLTFFVWLCASLGFCQNFFIIFSTSSEVLSPFLLSATFLGG